MLHINPIALLEKLKIPFWTEGKNCVQGWVNIQCPFCPDQSNHLGINLRNGAFHCWKCNESGGLEKLLKKHGKIGQISRADREALSWCHPRGDVQPQEKFDGKKCTFPNRMYPIFPIPKFLEGLAQSRNMQLSLIAKHAAGFTDALPSNFQYRLIFPNNIEGRLVSYVGMDYTGRSHMKYKASDNEDSEVTVKGCLYGYDDAPENSVLILVEGVFDKIRLGNHALAMYGTGWTMDQILLLRKKHPKKIIILFDSDDAGRTAAKKLLSAIWFCPCERVELTGYKDPGEMPQAEADKLMNMLTEGA